MYLSRFQGNAQSYGHGSYTARSQSPQQRVLIDPVLQPFLDQALAQREKQGRKFTEQDLVVESGLIYQTLAEVFVRKYTGDFSFILELQEKLYQYGSLSPAQLAGALNTLVAEELRRLPPKPEQLEATNAVIVKGDTTKPPLVAGWYTVVLPDKTHVTLRLWDTSQDALYKFNLPKGTLTVGYLRGPNNSDDSSYTAIGWIKGGRDLVYFKKYRNDEAYLRQRQAVEVLLGAADPRILGKAYALESGLCWLCGRRLTDDESIERGVGPICAQKIF